MSALSSFYEFHARHGLDLGELLVTWRPYAGARTAWKPFLHHVARHQPQRQRTIKLKTPKPAPRILTAAQVQRLLNACDRLRDRLLLAVLHDSGIRIGEALGLRHEDLAVAERELTVTPRHNDNRADQEHPAQDHPGQHRAAASVRRLPRGRVRRAGLRLCVRQPVGPPARPPAAL